MTPMDALAQIREFMRVAAKGNGPSNLVPGVLSILDAVSVDATPAQESHYFGDGCGIEVQHDTRHLPPLTMDDLVEIAARIEVPRPVDAAPPQGIDRDALERVLQAFIETRPPMSIRDAADRILALVRPVEGVTLTREEARLLVSTLQHTDEWHAAHLAALASRLEAS